MDDKIHNIKLKMDPRGPEKPFDILRVDHRYQYQIENAIKLCGILFFIFPLVNIVHQIAVRLLCVFTFSSKPNQGVS